MDVRDLVPDEKPKKARELRVVLDEEYNQKLSEIKELLDTQEDKYTIYTIIQEYYQDHCNMLDGFWKMVKGWIYGDSKRLTLEAEGEEITLLRKKVEKGG